MRRVLVIGLAAIVFSLPWEVGDRDALEPAAASPTSTVVPVADVPSTPASTETAPTPARDYDIPIPSSGADVIDLPAGEDYWTFLGTGLPENFVERVLEIDGVTAAYAYPAGTMHLTLSQKADGTPIDAATPGWFIPLDGVVISPDDFVTYLGIDLGLGENDVVLGESSAAIRGLEVGDTMTFASGAALTVAAVVPDEVFGEPEIIATSLDHFAEDAFKARAAVIRTTRTEASLRSSLETLYAPNAPFGLHARYLFADNGPRIVRSWVFMKEQFGEFEYRPARSGAVEIEPAWLAENIVEIDLPLLGETKCHRSFAETLTNVMNRLIDDGHGSIITRGTFYGCWNPRYIRGTTRLSRHSFGIAADINFSRRDGDVRGSPTHTALIAAMSEYGVHSGHVWTTPDPGHFEYYGFPDGRPTGAGAR